MKGHIRPLLRRVHLWMGLSLGAMFALLGLTGSALVFYVEIDAALNGPVETTQPAKAAAGWDSPLWDRALQAGRARFRDPQGTWSFEVTGEGGPIPARYYPASGHHSHHDHREMVWFSADGTRVTRSAPWSGYLMSWLYELHANLLIDETGHQIAGWSGFIILVLLITGIMAWWPRGSWRKALAFKRGAAQMRRLYDLHKLPGVWSMALLFLLAGTGALLALPDIRTQMLTAATGASDKPPAPQSSRTSGQQITVAQALAAARQALPDARLAFIDVPGPGADPFRMRVQVAGDYHRRFPSSFIYVDQYSGRVLAVHDVRHANSAAAIAKWIRPLHDGSVAGTPTRILAILIGLVPAALFVTGFLHWRRRAAARAHHHSTGSKS